MNTYIVTEREIRERKYIVRCASGAYAADAVRNKLNNIHCFSNDVVSIKHETHAVLVEDVETEVL